MNSGPEPIRATAYPNPDGTWWIRLEYDSAEVEEKGPISWDGEGSFYNEGLNSVVRWLPAGYGYKGSGSWEDLGDGSFTTALYRKGFG